MKLEGLSFIARDAGFGLMCLGLFLPEGLCSHGVTALGMVSTQSPYRTLLEPLQHPCRSLTETVV